MHSCKYVFHWNLLWLVWFSTLAIYIKDFCKINESTSKYWLTQVINPISICGLNSLFLPIELILKLKVNVCVTLVINRSLKFLSHVGLVWLWYSPTCIWEVIHFDELNEFFIKALSPGIECKSHLIVLGVCDLFNGCYVVVSKYIDCIFSTACLWFKKDIELNLGVNDWVRSRDWIKCAEQQQGTSNKQYYNYLSKET